MQTIDKLNELLNELFPNGKVMLRPVELKIENLKEYESNKRQYNSIPQLIEHIAPAGTLKDFGNGSSNQSFISRPMIGYGLASKVENEKTALIKAVLDLVNQELIRAVVRDIEIKDNNVTISNFVDAENYAAYYFELKIN